MSKQARLAAYMMAATEARLARERYITSTQIGERVGVNASQVRRDISQTFGWAGKRGTGYAVDRLVELILATIDRRRVVTELERTMSVAAPTLGLLA